MKMKQPIRAHPLRLKATNSTDRMRRTGSQGSTHPVYQSPEWRRLTAQIFATRGRWCEALDCPKPDHGANGRLFCHHIVELRDGNPDPFDPNGIIVLCQACHARRTVEAQTARAGQRFKFVP